MQIEQGANSLRVKATNQSAILRTIYYFGPIKRAEIAQKLDLTLPTITTNVNNMISEGIVREVSALGAAYRGFGRKARPVEIVPEARHFIGAEITGTRRCISIVNYCGEEIDSYHDGVVCMDYEKNMADTCGIMENRLKKCRLEWKDIRGVCFGLPGVVDSQEGILKVHPRNQWNNKRIREDFQRLTGYGGRVNVENNACVRAHGARIRQKESLGDSGSYVYLFVDIGIACPLIINNAGFTGSVVGAGEVGHMVMESNGLKCSCGNHGCLEAYSSDAAIISRCTEALSQGKAGKLKELCGTAEGLTMARILEAQSAGDEDVTAIVEKAIYTLGVAAANIINFTSPDTMLIECKLFGNWENRKLLRDTAKKNLCNKTYRGSKLVFVEPDLTGGARGAATVAIDYDLA